MYASPSIRTNPLASRADAQRLLRDLTEPLLAHFSPGRAQVRLGDDAAHYDRKAEWLEGFSRPLWGLAPLNAGGGDFAHWHLFRDGLVNGTDPDHPEFWGMTTDNNQRSVETAALGLALALAPEHMWDGLSTAGQARIAAWVGRIEQVGMPDNNWRFFSVIAGLGLERIGVGYDQSSVAANLDRIEGYYRGEGWYGDGPQGFIDYYAPFAIQFYSLVYARHRDAADPDRAATYRHRARQFAASHRHWFGQDGAGLAIGPSLTYRFAMAAFWGALAYADVEALPWGEIRGLWARNMRWWMAQPCFDAEGLMPVGYVTPNAIMREEYNTAGSPYWAYKAFLPLALPADHPFWTTPEAPIEAGEQPVTIAPAGMIVARIDGDVIALSAAPPRADMRQSQDKYAKFSYSSRYGLGVEADRFLFMGFVGDNILAFGNDGDHYYSRRHIDAARVGADFIETDWRAGPLAAVTTLQAFYGAWELRLHRVNLTTRVTAIESGHAIPVRGATRGADLVKLAARLGITTGITLSASDGHVSAIADMALAGAASRASLMVACSPNSNICFPQASVAALVDVLDAGHHLLATAVQARFQAEPQSDAGLDVAFTALMRRAGWPEADHGTPFLPIDWRREDHPASPLGSTHGAP